MANTLEMAKLFQTKLDQHVERESLTGYMVPNSATIKYSGGDTVKMPTLTVDGLANYSRTNGHVQGDVDLSYADYKMTQDRGRSFQLDAMDVDESAFLATAGNVMAEFQRMHVIPEIDAYRLARLAGKAVTEGQVTDGSATADGDLLDVFLDDLAILEDRLGTSSGLVVHMSALTRRRLSNSKRAASLIGSATFSNGKLESRVDTVNDAPIIITPQKRLSTGVTLSATNGWAPTVGAKRVNWLITARNVPIAVSKTDTPRIFDPMTNQKAHAWALDYRKFHDIWVPKNQLKGVQINTGAVIA